MAELDTRFYRFGAFCLDVGERRLLRGEETVPLPPKAFEVLLLLVTHSGHSLSKEELLHKVWPDAFVEEGNLTQTVFLLRKALGDTPNGSRYIETIPRRGYRFRGDVERKPLPEVSGPTRRFRPATWGLIAAALMLGASLGAIAVMQRLTADPPPVRFQVLGPENSTVGLISLSPDGRLLAFVANHGDGKDQIWLRSLDDVAARAISGTEGADSPFWSPDSRSIGFFADGKLKRIGLLGGTAQTICEAPNHRGAAWSRDGVILFTPNTNDVLYRVPDTGGTPIPVTSFDRTRQENTHRWPYFLPDGKHFLYLVRRASGRTRLFTSARSTSR